MFFLSRAAATRKPHDHIQSRRHIERMSTAGRCYDIHAFDLGITSSNYVMGGSTTVGGRPTWWYAPLQSLRQGGWAALPYVNCTFFSQANAANASACADFAWTDSTPLEQCCACGGGALDLPLPPPLPPPSPPCIDLVQSPGSWLLHIPSGSWASEGLADCGWM